MLQFSVAPTLLGVACFFVYCIIMGNTLDPATAFTALALFSVIGIPLKFFPLTLNYVVQAQVSVKRLEGFLLLPEVVVPPSEGGRGNADLRHAEVSPKKPSPMTPLKPQNLHFSPPEGVNPKFVGVPQQSTGSSPLIELAFETLRWPNNSIIARNPVKPAENLRFRKSEFVCIVGATGCGKSGFVSALLGELGGNSGLKNLKIRGAMRYCAQTPWIRNCSVRENIVGDWAQLQGGSDFFFGTKPSRGFAY